MSTFKKLKMEQFIVTGKKIAGSGSASLIVSQEALLPKHLPTLPTFTFTPEEIQDILKAEYKKNLSALFDSSSMFQEAAEVEDDAEAPTPPFLSVIVDEAA